MCVGQVVVSSLVRLGVAGLAHWRSGVSTRLCDWVTEHAVLHNFVVSRHKSRSVRSPSVSLSLGSSPPSGRRVELHQKGLHKG